MREEHGPDVLEPGRFGSSRRLPGSKAPRPASEILPGSASAGYQIRRTEAHHTLVINQRVMRCTPEELRCCLRANAGFVLVPGEPGDARRRSSLRYPARCLGMRDQVQREASCEEAMREVRTDPSPRPHPAFEADALARQVASWVGLLAYREVPQTDDWRW